MERRTVQKELTKMFFLESFPNAKLHETGEPRCCLNDLGIVEVTECPKFNTCLECWNQKAK